jgi:hypothetical protein
MGRVPTKKDSPLENAITDFYGEFAMDEFIAAVIDEMKVKKGTAAPTDVAIRRTISRWRTAVPHDANQLYLEVVGTVLSKTPDEMDAMRATSRRAEILPRGLIHPLNDRIMKGVWRIFYIRRNAQTREEEVRVSLAFFNRVLDNIGGVSVFGKDWEMEGSYYRIDDHLHFLVHDAGDSRSETILLITNEPRSDDLVMTGIILAPRNQRSRGYKKPIEAGLFFAAKIKVSDLHLSTEDDRNSICRAAGEILNDRQPSGTDLATLQRACNMTYGKDDGNLFEQFESAACANLKNRVVNGRRISKFGDLFSGVPLAVEFVWAEQDI